MNGKTHTIRRRLSVIALAASIAAIAIPAATAGGKQEGVRVLGPGLNTVEKQGPYGGYWIRKHGAFRVLGPGLGTVEKRGPYGAYWVAKSAHVNQQFTPSNVDRFVGSPDPRDTAQENQKATSVSGWFPRNTLADDWFQNIKAKTLNSQTITTSVGSQDNEPSMDEIHLYPRGSADNSLSSASIVDRTLGSQDPRDTYREVLGDAGFGFQKLHEQDVFAPTAAINAASANWAAKAKLLDVNGQPRRDIFKSAALEHGAAGFGNVFLGETKTTARSVIAPDYSHLPQEDRAGITHRGI